MTRVPAIPMTVVCLILLAAASRTSAADWPQWRGPQRNGVWDEKGLIEKFAGPQIPIKWRVKVGPGYSGPTVADGRVFLTDRVLDPSRERVHCWEEKTGKLLWQHEYPCEYTIGYTAGPRACVTVDRGLAFALGAMGQLNCFEAATGKILWKNDLKLSYDIQMPIWGIAGAPLIVGEQLIVQAGGAKACIVALDRQTGRQRWTALNDRASYSAPITVTQAGRTVVICWTGDSVSGLAPETGEVLWRYPFKPLKMPIGIATPVVQGDHLFVTSFYDGSLMLRLTPDALTVKEVWKRQGASERQTDGLHSIISTPVLDGKHIYGVDSYGELRCLKISDGERVWEDLTATPKTRWSTIHFVKNGDRYWMFNERGQLIIAKLTPEGFQEISRSQLLKPTLVQLRRRDGVCWSHPAYANKHVFARNDDELVCASLAVE